MSHSNGRLKFKINPCKIAQGGEFRTALSHLVWLCILVDSDFSPLFSSPISESRHHLCPISKNLTFQFWSYCMKSRMINCGCSVFVLFVYMTWSGDITNKSESESAIPAAAIGLCVYSWFQCIPFFGIILIYEPVALLAVKHSICLPISTEWIIGYGGNEWMQFLFNLIQ